MAFPVWAFGAHAAKGSASGFVVKSSWREPETVALMHLDLIILPLRHPSLSPWEGHRETEQGHTAGQRRPWDPPRSGEQRLTLEQQETYSLNLC